MSKLNGSMYIVENMLKKTSQILNLSVFCTNHARQQLFSVPQISQILQFSKHCIIAPLVNRRWTLGWLPRNKAIFHIFKVSGGFLCFSAWKIWWRTSFFPNMRNHVAQRSFWRHVFAFVYFSRGDQRKNYLGILQCNRVISYVFLVKISEEPQKQQQQTIFLIVK